jgi:hypothetical protein
MLMRALFVHVAHEIAGAARIRHSLRPLNSEVAKRKMKTSGAIRAAGTRNRIQPLSPANIGLVDGTLGAIVRNGFALTASLPRFPARFPE